MIPERVVNAVVLGGLLAVPLWALVVDEPFTITLATRAAIFALAAVGLNLALGFGVVPFLPVAAGVPWDACSG